MHVGRGPDIETACGILHNERSRPGRAFHIELASEHQLLLIPSRQRAHTSIDPSCADVERVHERLRSNAESAPIDTPSPLPSTPEREILHQLPIEKDSISVAVFRNESDRSWRLQLTSGNRQPSCKSAEQLVLTVSFHCGNSYDLARSDLEGRSVYAYPAVRILDRESLGAKDWVCRQLA
jgi:hypothetical protein